jgi:hypothetical protein
MRWTVTASGLGYRASSAAFCLALIILFSHAVIALAHMAWVFLARESSTAWSSLTDTPERSDAGERVGRY